MGRKRKTPLRVLQVFGSLNKGGAESRMMDVYRHLPRENVQFDFIVHGKEEGAFEAEIRQLGGRVYRGVPRYRLQNLGCYEGFWDTFFAAHPDYDIVHIHTTNSACPILRAAKRQGIRHRICHARSAGERTCFRRWFVRLHRGVLRRHATTCLAVSEAAGRFVFGQGYQVVPNAIEAHSFRYQEEERNQMRRRLGLEGRYVVGHVGRLQEEKNQAFLIRVFEQFVKERPQAVLLLVGDGKLRPQLEAQIAQAGLTDRVLLAGVQEKIGLWMQAMDVFVLPSAYEGMPGAAIEAQASGLPTLLSDRITREAAVLPELVQYLPLEQGESPWVAALNRCAKQGTVRRDTYPQMAAKQFDIQQVAPRYERFYQSIHTRQPEERKRKKKESRAHGTKGKA